MCPTPSNAVSLLPSTLSAKRLAKRLASGGEFSPCSTIFGMSSADKRCVGVGAAAVVRVSATNSGALATSRSRVLSGSVDQATSFQPSTNAATPASSRPRLPRRAG